MRSCLFAFLFLVALLTGCSLPASAHGHLTLRGSVASDAGAPLPGRQVEIILPGEYGMGGRDRRHGVTAEQLARHDEPFGAVTDDKGEFSIDLGDRRYQAALFYLPPLGRFPRNPPSPFLFMRVPSFPDERYAVETGAKWFRVFGTGEEEISLAQAHLAALTASSGPDKTPGKRGTVGVVDLRFHLP
jgi:hypothetical protein